MYDVKNVINNLKIISKSKNNTELAKKMEVGYDTLNSWIKRNTIGSSFDIIYKFCENNNYSLDEVFEITKNNIEEINIKMDFENITKRLFQELNLKNPAQFCKLLKINHSVFSNWKARDTIPYEEIVNICKEHSLSTDYIFFNREKEAKNYSHSNTILGKFASKLMNPEINFFYLEFSLLFKVIKENILVLESKQDLIDSIKKCNFDFSTETINSILKFFDELNEHEFKYIKENKYFFLANIEEMENISQSFTKESCTKS